MYTANLSSLQIDSDRLQCDHRVGLRHLDIDSCDEANPSYTIPPSLLPCLPLFFFWFMYTSQIHISVQICVAAYPIHYRYLAPPVVSILRVGTRTHVGFGDPPVGPQLHPSNGISENRSESVCQPSLVIRAVLIQRRIRPSSFVVCMMLSNGIPIPLALHSCKSFVIQSSSAIRAGTTVPGQGQISHPADTDGHRRRAPRAPRLPYTTSAPPAVNLLARDSRTVLTVVTAPIILRHRAI